MLFFLGGEAESFHAQERAPSLPCWFLGFFFGVYSSFFFFLLFVLLKRSTCSFRTFPKGDTWRSSFLVLSPAPRMEGRTKIIFSAIGLIGFGCRHVSLLPHQPHPLTLSTPLDALPLFT